MSHCLTLSQLWLPMSKPHSPMPEASLAAPSLPVIYLQEQHSSGAGLDQMAVISQTEAQRWEAWPILWSATRSNRCRSEWINGGAETPVCPGLGFRSAAEQYEGKCLIETSTKFGKCDLKCNYFLQSKIQALIRGPHFIKRQLIVLTTIPDLSWYLLNLVPMEA